MKRFAAAMLAAGLAAAPLPALAHKVKCFAAADGEAVSGYAWSGGGERLRGAPYRVLAPDGAPLREGRTDADGAFSFIPTQRCDHVIVVEAGEGHEARFVVRADELPGVGRAGPSGPAAGSGTAPVGTATPEPPPPGSVPMEAIVARAVGREVAPLRRELAAFADRQRLQDIVAGLGYIAGLAGAAFFFLGTRRRKG